MRISLLDFDRSDIYCHAKANIRLDGITQKACCMADEEKRIIKRFKTDENGKFADESGLYGLETVHGDVEILVGGNYKQ